MFSTYSDFAPAIILLTLAASLIIGRNITRDSLKDIDSIFAVLGFVFGLLMTLMNLIYISKTLFLLSPVIAVSCILYLRYRRVFFERHQDSLFQIDDRHNTMLSIIWFVLIDAALIT